MFHCFLTPASLNYRFIPDNLNSDITTKSDFENHVILKKYKLQS